MSNHGNSATRRIALILDGADARLVSFNGYDLDRFLAGFALTMEEVPVSAEDAETLARIVAAAQQQSSVVDLRALIDELEEREMSE